MKSVQMNEECFNYITENCPEVIYYTNNIMGNRMRLRKDIECVNVDDEHILHFTNNEDNTVIVGTAHLAALERGDFIYISRTKMYEVLSSKADYSDGELFVTIHAREVLRVDLGNINVMPAYVEVNKCIK